jgi:hypothetical protein
MSMIHSLWWFCEIYRFFILFSNEFISDILVIADITKKVVSANVILAVDTRAEVR